MRHGHCLDRVDLPIIDHAEDPTSTSVKAKRSALELLLTSRRLRQLSIERLAIVQAAEQEL
jgi:hypothetical protein